MLFTCDLVASLTCSYVGVRARARTLSRRVRNIAAWMKLPVNTKHPPGRSDNGLPAAATAPHGGWSGTEPLILGDGRVVYLDNPMRTSDGREWNLVNPHERIYVCTTELTLYAINNGPNDIQYIHPMQTVDGHLWILVRPQEGLYVCLGDPTLYLRGIGPSGIQFIRVPLQPPPQGP